MTFTFLPLIPLYAHEIFISTKHATSVHSVDKKHRNTTWGVVCLKKWADQVVNFFDTLQISEKQKLWLLKILILALNFRKMGSFSLFDPNFAFLDEKFPIKNLPTIF